MSSHEDKGKRYVSQLNAARVAGSWSEVPELVRKVNKHASSEKLLTQTATAEHHVISRISERPQTATRDSENPVTALRGTFDAAQNTRAEDVFQARSCLIWAACTAPASESWTSLSTADIVPLFDLYGQKATSLYTKIALLRAVYLQGKHHARKDEYAQALACWKASATWIELNLDTAKSTPHLAYWAELLLAELSISSGLRASVNERTHAMTSWSSITAKSSEASRNKYGNPFDSVPRSAVLKERYALASSNLRFQSTTALTRSQCINQLRTAETQYETMFLRDRKFPKATETNSHVEEWVEQVIGNWEIICGSAWSEADLGEGGRNAYTRNVLDILYRAATKTFHSLLILRRLFQVHKSLTEFELAYECLSTYVELAGRARDRAAKDGHKASDSDEIILTTIAEGIEGFCSYGCQREARRAMDLAVKIEDWLFDINTSHKSELNGHMSEVQDASLLSESALEIANRAIGIAKANWARWTPFVESRNELQDEAMAALQDSVRGQQPQLASIYAIALLCAERREISQALRWTKLALQRIGAQGSLTSSLDAREHCSFWHLLTLLLSAQQDFETGRQSSAAALDAVMLATSNVHGYSDLSTAGSSVIAAPDLECDELQRVVELQTTYLSFVELVDGPETALNQSSELLSTYAQLFRRFEVGDVRQATEQNLVPPKTAAGTIKSSRGSIFHRKRHTPSAVPSMAPSSINSATSNGTDVRPNTQASQAPTIQVTDEAGKPRERKHHSLIHRHRHLDGDGKSPPTQSGSTPAAEREKPAAASSNVIDHAITRERDHTSSMPPGRSLDSVPHNVASHENAPAPLHHNEQPPQQDVRLPTIASTTTSTSPIPRFPSTQAQKHALMVLHNIWLSIALLYQRSHIFDDASEAIDEAVKTAQRIEQIISATDSSAKALATAGWGAGKMSSDGIWANTFCARAELMHAVAIKRAEEGAAIPGDSLREVVEQYEQCLMYAPNHTKGIVGLSNILLDYYEKKVDLAKKVDGGQSFGIKTVKKEESITIGAATPAIYDIADPLQSQQSSGDDMKKSPENLNRIAARDRAYGLLDILTKSGEGWDNSEAWFALARAHELGGEIEKAKKILWWCIELEDTKPIRSWSTISPNGYVL